MCSLAFGTYLHLYDSHVFEVKPPLTHDPTQSWVGGKRSTSFRQDSTVELTDPKRRPADPP